MSKTREALLAEKAELEQANLAAPCWGAAVGARLEVIEGIDSALRHLDTVAELPPSKSASDEEPRR